MGVDSCNADLVVTRVRRGRTGQSAVLVLTQPEKLYQAKLELSQAVGVLEKRTRRFDMPKKGHTEEQIIGGAEAVRKRRKSGGDLPETRRQPGHRRAVSRRQRR